MNVCVSLYVCVNELDRPRRHTFLCNEGHHGPNICFLGKTSTKWHRALDHIAYPFQRIEVVVALEVAVDHFQGVSVCRLAWVTVTTRKIAFENLNDRDGTCSKW